MTGRRALLAGAEAFVVRPAGRPVVGPGDVRLEVLGVGVCGSDVALYRTGDAGPDQVLGHEIVARVVEVGAAVPDGSPGAVAMIRPMRSCGCCAYCLAGATHLCDRSQELTLSFRRPGGYADDLVLTDAEADELHPVADGVDVADAIWAEPLAVAIRGVNRLGPLAAATPVLVIGGGPLGLCVTAAARARGLSPHVVEPRDTRRAAAVRAGAVEAHSGAYPATVVTSGAEAAVAAAVAATGPGGTVSILALGSATVPTAPAPVRVVGSFGYLIEDFRAAVKLINSGAVRLGFAVSHRFPLADIDAAFRVAAHDPAAVKVMIDGSPRVHTSSGAGSPVVSQ